MALSQFLRFFWTFYLSIKSQSLGTTGLNDVFSCCWLSDLMEVLEIQQVLSEFINKQRNQVSRFDYYEYKSDLA